MMLPEKIEFNRPSRYKTKRVLGNGACGETVLLHDEDMSYNLVAKKYCPIISKHDEPELFKNLLKRFKEEARILFQLNHPNIVRVYNFFDYHESGTAYILMEFVDGVDILDHAQEYPESVAKVFEGVVEGFSHLQKRGVLHRDIRPANILIGEDAVPKIIDFGFGKSEIFSDNLEDKSISLNWWCETPPEFSESIYDGQTEIYFVGKLFQKIVVDNNLSNFKYMQLLSSMTEADSKLRPESFAEISNTISLGKFAEISFERNEKIAYRNFADALTAVISSIASDAEIERDSSVILTALEDLFRRSMLEEFLAEANKVVSVFVSGAFRYWTKEQFSVEVLRDFIALLKGFSGEKRKIVLDNLSMRLESIDRTKERDLDDEIPF